MESIPDPQGHLAGIKKKRHGYRRPRFHTRDDIISIIEDGVSDADIDWLISELQAAFKAIDLVKQDGHIYPEEGNCLTCEAVAEFDARHG